MLGDSLEHLPNESAGCPIRHGNDTAGAANAGEFGRDEFGTRRKHRADQAHNGVKLTVLIRQRLGITLFKGDGDPLLGCAGPCFLKPVRGNVTAGYLGACPGRNQRKLSSTAADIQQPGSPRDTEPAEKLFRVLLHIPGESVVISRHPRRFQPSLELLKLAARLCFFCNCTHSVSLLLYLFCSCVPLSICLTHCDNWPGNERLVQQASG